MLFTCVLQHDWQTGLLIGQQLSALSFELEIGVVIALLWYSMLQVKVPHWYFVFGMQVLYMRYLGIGPLFRSIKRLQNDLALIVVQKLVK